MKWTLKDDAAKTIAKDEAKNAAQNQSTKINKVKR